jgi:hypothetical protein
LRSQGGDQGHRRTHFADGHCVKPNAIYRQATRYPILIISTDATDATDATESFTDVFAVTRFGAPTHP